MTTTAGDQSTTDRFARRKRSWTRIPGVPAEPAGSDSAGSAEAEITVVGEHLLSNLKGTFFPDAMFQAVLLMTAVFFVLLAVVHFAPPTVGAPAEPLNQELYLPRPAWYFYFLFQILEWAKGPIFVPIGTVWLPNIAILALLLVPVYDRNKNHRITKRPLAILFFYGSVLFIVVVTAYNVITTPAEPTKNNENHAPVQQPAAPQGDLPAAVVSW